MGSLGGFTEARTRSMGPEHRGSLPGLSVQCVYTWGVLCGSVWGHGLGMLVPIPPSLLYAELWLGRGAVQSRHGGRSPGTTREISTFALPAAPLPPVRGGGLLAGAGLCTLAKLGSQAVGEESHSHRCADPSWGEGAGLGGPIPPPHTPSSPTDESPKWLMGGALWASAELAVPVGQQGGKPPSVGSEGMGPGSEWQGPLLPASPSLPQWGWGETGKILCWLPHSLQLTARGCGCVLGSQSGMAPT